jgi:hypothetical protein
VVVDEVVVIDSRGSIADWQVNLSLKRRVLGQSIRRRDARAVATPRVGARVGLDFGVRFF